MTPRTRAGNIRLVALPVFLNVSRLEGVAVDTLQREVDLLRRFPQGILGRLLLARAGGAVPRSVKNAEDGKEVFPERHDALRARSERQGCLVVAERHLEAGGVDA